MDDLVYKHERPLFALSLAFSLAAWLLLLVGTFGMALLYAPFVFLFYVFTQSALIAYLKGTAVRVGPRQFPDLHQRLQACCERLGVTPVPECYVLNGQGLFNAFATRFLGRNFLVLLSDVVDAMESRPGGINFYLGHELGHIHRRHLTWQPVLAPAGILPLLGAAYHRARESTCDNYGLACCDDGQDALVGLGALAAGGKRCQDLALPEYSAQVRETGGFWMSFHELVSDYPWLTKRAARILSRSGKGSLRIPSRSPLAYFFAMFIPRTMGGAAGGGILSLLVVVAMIGIIAAIAIPTLLRARVAANEAAVIGDLRTVASAEAAFRSATGHYGTLACLAKPEACLQGYAGPAFLPAAFVAKASKNGYSSRFRTLPPQQEVGDQTAWLQGYTYTATPLAKGQTGVRSFCTDGLGFLRFSSDGEDPDVSEGRCPEHWPTLR